MSLEDNSVTQLSTLDEPAIEDNLGAGDRPPRFAGEQTVPLRDPATAELERERDERVRVLTRRPRTGLPRPSRRSAAVLVVALAAIAMTVVALTGRGPGGSVPTAAPAGAEPAASPSTHREATSAPPLPTTSPRHQTRRRADLAAERRAARRRVLAGHRRHSSHAGDGAHRQGHRVKGRSTSAAAASPEAQPAETTEPTTAAPTPAEAAPEAEVVQEAPAAEAPPPEAAPEPTSAPTPPPSESRSPAESEFDFER